MKQLTANMQRKENRSELKFGVPKLQFSFKVVDACIDACHRSSKLAFTQESNTELPASTPTNKLLQLGNFM